MQIWPQERKISSFLWNNFRKRRNAFLARFSLVLFYKVLLYDTRKLSPSLQAIWDTLLGGRSTFPGAEPPAGPKNFAQESTYKCRPQKSRNVQHFSICLSRPQNRPWTLRDTLGHSRTLPTYPTSSLETPWQLSRKVEISWKSRFFGGMPEPILQ